MISRALAKSSKVIQPPPLSESAQRGGPCWSLYIKCSTGLPRKQQEVIKTAFTKEELEAMRLADEEIEEEFELSQEDFEFSRAMDRQAMFDRLDPEKKKASSHQKVYQKANKERRAASRKVYYEANKESIAAYHKAYYEAHRPELLAYQRAYEKSNKERRAAYFKAYREANKEKVSAYRKAYYQANKERLTAHQRAYRKAKREGLAAPEK